MQVRQGATSTATFPAPILSRKHVKFSSPAGKTRRRRPSASRGLGTRPPRSCVAAANRARTNPPTAAASPGRPTEGFKRKMGERADKKWNKTKIASVQKFRSDRQTIESIEFIYCSMIATFRMAVLKNCRRFPRPAEVPTGNE